MTDQHTEPDLPYAGTSGFSGSATSQARAVADDTSGKTTERQSLTLSRLRGAETTGLTYRDLGEAFGWHHGQSSGALSVLHKTGRIARLAKVKRNRCAVYVLPEYVGDRETEPHGGKSRGLADHESDALDVLRNDLARANRLGLGRVACSRDNLSALIDAVDRVTR